MPLSRMRVLPIAIWSPSRILGTPVTSAACATIGSSNSAIAGRNFIDMQKGRVQ